MPVPASLRGVRAAGTAVAAVALAVTAHVAGGGTAPRTTVLVAAVLLGAVGAYAGGGRERSLLSVTAGTLSLQAVLHVVLETTTTTPIAPAPSVPAMPGMSMSGPAMSAHTMSGPAMAGGVPGAAMTAAHVGAALALAWWLRRGERLLWQALRALTLRVFRPLGPVPAAPARALARPADVALPTSRLPAGWIRRRGPPAFSTRH